MKKTTICWVLLTTAQLLSCRPKEIAPPDLGKVWKARSVKENGVLVYMEGNTGNIRPGYAGFRLDLTGEEQVVYTDLDGRRLTGDWYMSTDYRRLILENLTPPPSASAGNIEFYINDPLSESQLSLTRTNESRKTGNTVNEYELVPE